LSGKIRLAILLTAILLASACGLEPYVAVFEDWTYTFNDGGIQFTSLDELNAWVNRYIAYNTDLSTWGWADYWASPEQIYKARMGDCNSYAILFMYYAYSRHLAANPALAGIQVSAGTGHAIVRIGDNYWDPTNGTKASVSSLANPVWYTLNYGKTMYIATHDHNAWKGISRANALVAP